MSILAFLRKAFFPGTANYSESRSDPGVAHFAGSAGSAIPGATIAAPGGVGAALARSPFGPSADTRRALRAVALLALLFCAARAVDTMRQARRTDFEDWQCYYRAAERLVAGGDLYADAEREVERHSYAYWQTTSQYPYPPLLAILLAPMTRLGEQTASWIWLGLIALAIAGLIALFLRCLERPPRLETLAPVALVVLASTPLLIEVGCGQVDFLLAVLLTLALVSYLEDRDVLAGIAIGAAAAVKPMLAVYLLFYLRKGRWKTIGSAIVSGIALGLGPFLFLPRSEFDAWLSTCFYYSTPGGNVSYPYNQSSRGLLLRAFVGGPTNDPILYSPWLATVLWALLALATLVVALRLVPSGRTSRERTLIEYSLVVAAVLFVGPQSEDLYFTHLLLGLAILADTITWRPVSRPLAVLGVAACLYYAQPWLEFAYNHGGRHLEGILFSGAYLWGLALAVPALVLALREVDGRSAV